MTYRPTVRYAPIFKEYVNKLFHATTLDRNQIIRAALFVAGNSNEFRRLMSKYKKKDLPMAPWGVSDHSFWLERCPDIKEIKVGERDVKDKQSPDPIKIKNEGGIRLTL